jgi:hypothetical protein
MIIVGTTLAAFVMDKQETWSSWLNNSEQIINSHPEVLYFAAIEVDKRGIAPFEPLIKRLAELNGDYYTYSLDDRREQVTGDNRISHITTGRNIVHDYATGRRASHILFLDADTTPDPNTLPKLLEMEHPLVGGEVGTYCLSGPRVDKYPYPVEEHMNTAGYLLVADTVFRRIRWRSDWGMTDDPCFNRDAIDFLGIPTYVRKDCIGTHYPPSIGPIETRGHDMTVYRN